MGSLFRPVVDKNSGFFTDTTLPSKIAGVDASARPKPASKPSRGDTSAVKKLNSAVLVLTDPPEHSSIKYLSDFGNDIKKLKMQIKRDTSGTIWGSKIKSFKIVHDILKGVKKIDSSDPDVISKNKLKDYIQFKVEEKPEGRSRISPPPSRRSRRAFMPEIKMPEFKMPEFKMPKIPRPTKIPDGTKTKVKSEEEELRLSNWAKIIGTILSLVLLRAEYDEQNLSERIPNILLQAQELLNQPNIYSNIRQGVMSGVGAGVASAYQMVPEIDLDTILEHLENVGSSVYNRVGTGVEEEVTVDENRVPIFNVGGGGRGEFSTTNARNVMFNIVNGINLGGSSYFNTLLNLASWISSNNPNPELGFTQNPPNPYMEMGRGGFSSAINYTDGSIHEQELQVGGSIFKALGSILFDAYVIEFLSIHDKTKEKNLSKTYLEYRDVYFKPSFEKFIKASEGVLKTTKKTIGDKTIKVLDVAKMNELIQSDEKIELPPFEHKSESGVLDKIKNVF